MQRFSLTTRLVIGIFLSLFIFVPLANFSLQSAFKSSLEASIKQRLQSQLYFLIAELEVDGDNLFMPEFVADESLNQLDSGTYAFINSKQLSLWRSRSADLLDISPQLPTTQIGDEQFSVQDFQQLAFYRLSLTVLFDVYGKEQPFSFHVLYDKSLVDEEILTFRKTLRRWMFAMAMALLFIQLIWLRMALSPLKSMREQISAVELGKQESIQGSFPKELQPITQSINKLINTELQQRTRYKNSLSDLAHALKTPLAIIKGQRLNEEADQQVNQINKLIERQLKRAASGGTASWHLGIKIKPVLEKLISAMKKIYVDKSLSFDSTLDEETIFYGDEQDLMELLGNLIDNASKAAKSRVKVTAESNDEMLVLQIEDDGNGIPDEHKNQLLNRGTRLDTYSEGHGIGLAIVNDLVSSYQGNIEIKDSDLGGALFVIRFKR